LESGLSKEEQNLLSKMSYDSLQNNSVADEFEELRKEKFKLYLSIYNDKASVWLEIFN